MSSPSMPLRVARRSRLLVVEDEPITAEVLYHALSDEHEMLMATSGEPALALARDKAPDAVLLDVTLPGLDGFEVCRRLKADALTRDIPVIFITSHDDLDIEAHGLDCGAVDFLTKPVHPPHPPGPGESPCRAEAAQRRAPWLGVYRRSDRPVQPARRGGAAEAEGDATS